MFLPALDAFPPRILRFPWLEQRFGPQSGSPISLGGVSLYEASPLFALRNSEDTRWESVRGRREETDRAFWAFKQGPTRIFHTETYGPVELITAPVSSKRKRPDDVSSTPSGCTMLDTGAEMSSSGPRVSG